MTVRCWRYACTASVIRWSKGLRMRNFKTWAGYVVALTATMLSASCGGGGGEPLLIPQFNVTERQLYEPGKADAGIVVRRGSGGVSLQLEAPNAATGLPLNGDTGSTLGQGVDRFYFDLVDSGYISLSMSDEMSRVIRSVELYDADEKLLWRLDQEHRTPEIFWLYRTDYRQAPARYQVRIAAAATAADQAHLLVWFGDALVMSANPTDLGKLNVGQAVSCAYCNLSGAALGAYRLEGAYLAGANLRNAWLVRLPGPQGLSLDSNNLLRLLWNDSQAAGASMKGAFLAGVDFTGAIVTGAGISPADFQQAHLYEATFHGVNLDRVNMRAAFLNRARLTSSSMIEADLSTAHMAETDFSGSNLHKAKFNKGLLTDARFTNANLAGADFTDALISGANFVGANLSGAIWSDGRICAEGSVGTCQ